MFHQRWSLIGATILVLTPLVVAEGAYDVLISDRVGKIHKYTEAGAEITGPAFTAPTIAGLWGIAADSTNQKIYAGSTSNGTITRLNANGTFDTTFTLTNGVASAAYTYGMDVGPDGDLYIIAASGGAGGNNQIWKIDTSTSTVSLLSTATSGVVYDLVAGADGFLYVAERQNARVLKVNASTGASAGVFIPHGGGNTPPQVDDPHAIDFDLAGNLVVVDSDRFGTGVNNSQTWLIRHFDIDPVLTDVGPTWTADNSVGRLHVGVGVAPDGRTFFTGYNPDSLYGDVGVFTSGGSVSNFTNISGTDAIQVDFLTPLIPEPASLSLLALGGVALTRRRVR